MLISVKDIINKSLELYKNNWQLFLKYMLWLFIPTGLIAITTVILGSFTAALIIYGFGVIIVIYVLIFLMATIFSLWISLAFIRAMVARCHNKPVKNTKEELKTTIHLILPAVLVSFLTFLIILGGLVLVIIPGIIFIVWFAFTFYAVAIDENKTLQALHTSKELVTGRWWATLWRLLAPAIIFGIIILLVQWLINIPLEAVINNLTQGSLTYAIAISLITLLSTAISLLFTPLTSAAPTILYLELKKTSAKIVSTESSIE